MIPELDQLINGAGIVGYNRIENRLDVAYWNEDKQMFISAGAVISDVGILLWVAKAEKLNDDGDFDMTVGGYTPNTFEEKVEEMGLGDQWILKETINFFMEQSRQQAEASLGKEEE